MERFSTWGDTFVSSLQNSWSHVITALPTFVGVVIVVIVGLIVSKWLGRLLELVIRRSGLDTLVNRSGVPDRIKSWWPNFSLSSVLGWVTRVFFAVVTLLAAADILQWTAITDFFNRLLLFIPNILIAVIIVAVAVAIGRALGEAINRSLGSAGPVAGLPAKRLGLVAEWGLTIFGIMAALTQLGVAEQLIEILFAGIVIAAALAVGLSFGLGGRESVQRWLDRVTRSGLM